MISHKRNLSQLPRFIFKPNKNELYASIFIVSIGYLRPIFNHPIEFFLSLICLVLGAFCLLNAIMDFEKMGLFHRVLSILWTGVILSLGVREVGVWTLMLNQSR